MDNLYVRAAGIFLGPVVITLLWLLLPVDTSWDASRVKDSWAMFTILKLPVACAAWIGALLATIHPVVPIPLIKALALILAACVWFSVSMYVAVEHISIGGKYLPWIIAVTLAITILISGVATAALGMPPGRRIFAFRVTLMHLVIGGQITFSMYFGTVLFAQQTQQYPRVLLCAMYPIAIRCIQIVMDKVRPKGMMWMAVFCSQCFASFPYRLLFPIFGMDWEMWGYLMVVEFVFKFATYLFPLSPTGTVMLKYLNNKLTKKQPAKRDMSLYIPKDENRQKNFTASVIQGAWRRHKKRTTTEGGDGMYALARRVLTDKSTLTDSLSTKFVFHQIMDGSNPMLGVVAFGIVASVPLETYGPLAHIPTDALHTLIAMYCSSVVYEIILYVAFTMIAKRVTKGRFDPMGRGLPAVCSAAWALTCAITASYVVPLLYIQVYHF